MSRPEQIRALDLIERVLDPGSHLPWPDPSGPPGLPADPDYAAELTAARARTGLDEALVTGEGRISGRRVAVAACEFGFLAGSIGVAAAERLTRAIERATAERLPLVASPTSGGTRMQEGTVAFLQMVKISAAVAAHRAAGLPYLVYLRHPTTGGVFASWGSLGHVTAAQPGALIGFLGPRVYDALYGRPFPAGVQLAENLYEHGLIDAVVEPGRLREVAARVLGVLAPDPPPDGETGTAGTAGTAGSAAASGLGAVPGATGTSGAGGAGGTIGEAGDGGDSGESGNAMGAGDVGDSGGGSPGAGVPQTGVRGPGSGAPAGSGEPEGDSPASAGADGDPPQTGLPEADVPDTPAWTCVQRSRDPARPGLRALLHEGATDVTPLRGTGEGESEPGLRLALARFGEPCVVLGQDRTRQSEHGPFGPAGLRQARRGMRLAAELGLPLVTVIDTAGAALSREAEEGGLAGEIARCLAELVMLSAPTVCLLLGQGSGGGALALLPADRVVCAEHAWLSPLPPEGASAILYRTTERAPEVAARQGIRALDLRRAGIADRIVRELPDAAREPGAFVGRVARTLAAELRAVRGRDPGARVAARLARYRALGLDGAGAADG